MKRYIYIPKAVNDLRVTASAADLAGLGAQLGAVVGTVIPGLGTTIGAAAGGVLGGIGEAFGVGQQRRSPAGVIEDVILQSVPGAVARPGYVELPGTWTDHRAMELVRTVVDRLRARGKDRQVWDAVARSLQVSNVSMGELNIVAYATQKETPAAGPTGSVPSSSPSSEKPSSPSSSVALLALAGVALSLLK